MAPLLESFKAIFIDRWLDIRKLFRRRHQRGSDSSPTG